MNNYPRFDFTITSKKLYELAKSFDLFMDMSMRPESKQDTLHFNCSSVFEWDCPEVPTSACLIDADKFKEIYNSKFSIIGWLLEVTKKFSPYTYGDYKGVANYFVEHQEELDSSVSSANFLKCWYGSGGTSYFDFEERKANEVKVYSVNYSQWNTLTGENEGAFQDFMNQDMDEIYYWLLTNNINYLRYSNPFYIKDTNIEK